MSTISLLWPANFSFDEARATEIAAYLIQRTGKDGKLNYTKLLKLMYIVDRKALLEWMRPAVGGDYVSMNNGPVMSETYDLIKGASSGSGVWEGHIEKVGRYSVHLKHDPGTGHMTKALKRLIDGVIQEHGKKSYGQLIDYCHDNYKEWKSPAGSSQAIAYEEILKVEGRLDKINSLKREAKELRQIERALAC